MALQISLCRAVCADSSCCCERWCISFILCVCSIVLFSPYGHRCGCLRGLLFGGQRGALFPRSGHNCFGAVLYPVRIRCSNCVRYGPAFWSPVDHNGRFCDCGSRLYIKPSLMFADQWCRASFADVTDSMLDGIISGLRPHTVSRVRCIGRSTAPCRFPEHVCDEGGQDQRRHVQSVCVLVARSTSSCGLHCVLFGTSLCVRKQLNGTAQPRCFASYMSLQCSSVFPRCTAPQSRDEPMPAGGRVPLCLHLCIIPLVTCPGFWINDVIGTCTMVSVPPMCTQAFYWNLVCFFIAHIRSIHHQSSENACAQFRLPPQYVSYDEANPYPKDCPNTDLSEFGMDAAEDPALYEVCCVSLSAMESMRFLCSIYLYLCA